MVLGRASVLVVVLPVSSAIPEVPARRSLTRRCVLAFPEMGRLSAPLYELIVGGLGWPTINTCLLVAAACSVGLVGTTGCRRLKP